MPDQIIKTINPFNLETIAEYPYFTPQNLNKSIKNAEIAFKNWKKVPFKTKSNLMLKLAEILRGNKNQYAELMTLEMGKPINEAIAEIEKSAFCCSHFAESAEKMLASEDLFTESKNLITHEPIGAILAVMPWNYPFWQVFRFASTAIMAGNVVLLKHAPNVTGCALAIEDVFKKAGFGDVFQSILIEIKDIKKVVQADIVQGITLTGSERAGASLASLAAKNIKKSVLELGGSDALLVLEDADIENAATTAIQSRMLNAGQSCISAKRFFVLEKHLEIFQEHALDAIKKFKIGNPLDPSVQMGPMARVDLAEALEKQLNDAISKGAEIIYGGKRENCFFEPTLLRGCTTNMSVFKEETFGPLGCIFTVKNEKEMIKLANKSRYGLGCSIWSNDIKKAEKVALQIEAGNVFINKMVKSDPRLPFGGIKKSGFGREMGEWGIKEFTNTKVIAF